MPLVRILNFNLHYNQVELLNFEVARKVAYEYANGSYPLYQLWVNYYVLSPALLALALHRCLPNYKLTCGDDVAPFFESLLSQSPQEAPPVDWPLDSTFYSIDDGYLKFLVNTGVNLTDNLGSPLLRSLLNRLEVHTKSSQGATVVLVQSQFQVGYSTYKAIPEGNFL